MTTLDLTLVASALAAYAISFARLADKARWAWHWLPSRLQPFLPALLIALPEFALALGGVKTWSDFLESLVVAGGAVAAAMRGALPKPVFDQLSKAAKIELKDARNGEGVTPPKPPSIPPLSAAMLAFSLLALSGCSHPPDLPTGSATRQVAQGAFAASVLVLRSLDEINSAWMDSVQAPSAEQVAAEREITSSIVAARDALKKAEPCIADGGACVEELRKASNQLAFVATALERLGRPMPDEVTGVLAFVADYSRESGGGK